VLFLAGVSLKSDVIISYSKVWALDSGYRYRRREFMPAIKFTVSEIFSAARVQMLILDGPKSVRVWHPIVKTGCRNRFVVTSM